MSIPQTDYTLSNPQATRRKPILCVDFDGVIHSYTTPWTGAYIIPDPPVDGAFDALMAYTEVFDVHIYSARSATPAGRQAIHAWFVAWGWPTDDAGRLIGLTLAHEKPKAFLTLDDRCVCFTGTFPSVNELKQFKTWQQRGK